MVVHFENRDLPLVEVPLDPGPYRSRQVKHRKTLLLQEFERRVGDLNVGGINKRPIVTAYRQDALRCAARLQANGPTRLADLRRVTRIAKVAQMMQRDVYGWFRRTQRGVYEITPNGEKALEAYADVVKMLNA